MNYRRTITFCVVGFLFSLVITKWKISMLFWNVFYVWSAIFYFRYHKDGHWYLASMASAYFVWWPRIAWFIWQDVFFLASKRHLHNLCHRFLTRPTFHFQEKKVMNMKGKNMIEYIISVVRANRTNDIDTTIVIFTAWWSKAKAMGKI